MPRYIGELITAGIIAALALLVLRGASSLPSGGDMLPDFAATCTLLLALYWAGTAVLRRREPDRAERIEFSLGYDRLKPMIVAAATLAYVGLMFVTGFFVATTLYLVGVSVILGVANWRMTAATVIVVMPLIYLFFVTFLGARLPQGFAI